MGQSMFVDQATIELTPFKRTAPCKGLGCEEKDSLQSPTFPEQNLVSITRGNTEYEAISTLFYVLDFVPLPIEVALYRCNKMKL